MKGSKNGIKYEIPADEAAAIQAEWDAYVPAIRFRVEQSVGAGANKVGLDDRMIENLTTGQVTALQAAGYTVTKL